MVSRESESERLLATARLSTTHRCKQLCRSCLGVVSGDTHLVHVRLQRSKGFFCLAELVLGARLAVRLLKR